MTVSYHFTLLQTEPSLSLGGGKANLGASCVSHPTSPGLIQDVPRTPHLVALSAHTESLASLGVHVE